MAAGQLLPSLEIASSGTVNFGSYVAIGENFKYTSGTVNTAGSIFEINGGLNSSIIDSGVMTFNNVIVAKQDVYDLYVTGVMKVGGNLTFNNQVVFENVFYLGTIEVGGNVTVTDLQGGYGVVKLVGSGTQNISIAAGQLLPSLEIASSGTVNFGSYVAISDNFKYTSGTVNTTGSVFEINGKFNSSFIDSGNMVFNNVLVAKQDTYDLYVTGVMKVGGDLTFNSAPGFTNTIEVGTIAASGNVTVSDFQGGPGSLSLTGSNSQTVTVAAGQLLPEGTITVDKSSGRVIQGSAISLGASQDIVFAQAGTWDMAGYNLTVDQLNGSAGAGSIYKQCTGTLTYNTLVPTINIYNGTAGVGLSIADAADVTENDATDVNQTFVVTVSPQNCVATTFNYATQDGTATAPADYTAITATSTNIPANTSSITLTAVTKPDNINEGNENYTVQLSSLMTGVTATDISGQGVILDDDIVPASIYRSVGPGNTSILSQGGTNALSIGGGVASFASTDLPNNVGVGDVIYYDSDNNGSRDAVIFISGRTDARNFSVKTALGATPANIVTPDQDWRIYRAYTSLNDAAAGTENTSIGVNFDGVISTRDLVANNEQWNFAVYGDGIDTIYPAIGFSNTSDATRYLRLYSPYLSTEVGVTQRHNGTWQPNVATYYIGSDVLINMSSDYMRIDGFLVQKSSGGTSGNGNSPAIGLDSGYYVQISNNVARCDCSVLGGYVPTEFLGTMGPGNRIQYIFNNIAYGFRAPGGEPPAIAIDVKYQNSVLYNNTVVDSDRAYYSWSGSTNILAKNNIAQNISQDAYYFGGASTTGSSNNLSNLADAVGANAKNNKTVAFRDPANRDYRLSLNDFEAIDLGLDLSADATIPFANDVSGIARSAPWDIGASEAGGAMPIYRSVGPGNTTALVCGVTTGSCTGNAATVTFSSSLVTFSTGVPSNVGIGDALIWDSNTSASLNSGDSVAFIVFRLSSTQFYVRTASGATVSSSYSGDKWAIFRAYTSLANAADSSLAGTENSALAGIIGAANANFDTLPKNLVTADQIWNIAAYNDAVETAHTGVGNWTTDPNHYVKIFTPTTTNEVGVSQRHDGTWGTGYRITNDIYIDIDNYYIDGLSLRQSATNSTLSIGQTTGNYGIFRIANSILWNEKTAGGCGAVSGFINNKDIYVWNNLIVASPSNSNPCDGIYFNGPSTYNIYFYNNTAIQKNGFLAIAAQVGKSWLKNNIAYRTGSGVGLGGDNIQSAIYNATNDASADDWGGTGNRINQSFSFIDSANGDFRLSTTDSSAKDLAVNLSTDSLFAFNYDFLGSNRNSGIAWDIGAHEAATPIYRSVGPGNTSALANGAGNNLTISGTTATFTTALPTNIGVGDALQYATTGTTINAVVFITKRTSSTVYEIQTADGRVPVSRAAFASWNIFRAYTSLANAETGTENTGIDNAIENFDTWSGGKDILAANQQWNIALYSDAADATSYWYGWITDSLRFVRIFAPSLSTEVGVSQRHVGIWDDSKARIVNDSSDFSDFAIESSIEHFRMEGIEIDQRPVLGLYQTVIFGVSNPLGAKAEHYYIGNFLKGSSNMGTAINYHAGSTSAKIYILNNIIIAQGSYGIGGENATYVVYNNTVKGASYGFSAAPGTYVYLKNNININSVIADYSYASITLDPSSDANISSDASSPNAAFRNKTVSFLDIGHNDYRLSSEDIEGKNRGLNLSADSRFAFSTDIMNHTRGTDGYWDIGAHEAATAIYRSVGPTKTSALATGAANGMTISNGLATFASALPSNVGVGDAIHYDGDGNGSRETVIFISSRTDSTHFNTVTTNGLTPNSLAVADLDWIIYRAYTSLSNAESGVENTSIGMNFDSWTNGRDLFTNNEKWNIALYSDAQDTGPVIFDGWSSSETNNLNVFVPSTSAQVGISQRHTGAWDTSKYRIRSTDKYAIVIGTDYFSLDGLQIDYDDQVGDFNYQWAIQFGIYGNPALGTNGGNVSISNNIVKGNNGLSKVGLDTVFSSWNLKAKIYNNIFYNMSYAGIAVESGGDYSIYNNTFVNTNLGTTLSCAAGGSGNLVVLKNNIVQNSSADSYSDSCGWGYNAASSTNLSDDATIAAAGDLINKTVTFVDAAANDYRLSLNDTSAKGAGLNLSADSKIAFNTDIAGLTRTAPWDIGASKAVPGGYQNLSGLVGLWSLNENSASNGTVIADSSGNGYNGTLITDNGTTNKSVAGKVNSAITFDGTTDKINIPDNNAFDFPAGSDFSVSMWFRSSQTVPDYSELVSHGGTFALEATFFNSFDFGVMDSNSVSAQAVTTGNRFDGLWHHAVGVKSGNNVLLYMDGVLVASASAAFTGNFSSTSVLAIGYQPPYTEDTVADIDEVSLWGRALSASDVLQLYTQQSKPYISIANATVAEGSGPQLVATLSGVSASNVVFDYSTGDGTAVAASDYTASVARATIPAGSLSVTLPVIPVADDGAAETTEYFTVTLSNLMNAKAGTQIVSTVTVVDSTNGLRISNLIATAISTNGFTANIDYLGDADLNATVTLYYCNKTDSASCTPTTSLGTMTAGAGVYTKAIAGLSTPNDPGDTLKLQVVVTDSSGVVGSPLSGEVTLMSTNGTVTGALSFSNITTTAFDSTLTFSGDANNNSSANIYYCNQTDSSSCAPTTLIAAMTRNNGVSFTRSNGGFSSPNDPGDTLKIKVTVTDANGVDGGSPKDIYSTVTLAASSDPYYPNLSNLIFRYKFDDATQQHNSTIDDIGPNNLDGTLLTSDGTTSKKLSPSVVTDGTQLDGVNDKITIPYNAALDMGTSNFSAGIWVKYTGCSTGTYCDFLRLKDANGGSRGLISIGADIGTPDGIYFSLKDTNGMGLSAQMMNLKYLDGEWHYIVGTKSGHTPATLSLYIDGELVKTNTFTFTANIDMTAVSELGFGYNTFQNSYAGAALDEATLWGRALTASEIEEIYLRQAPKKIYRSVGPGNKLALATGTSNAMTITGDTATFASALPDRVGVGDAIQYDSDGNGYIDKIVFVSKRYSSTSYRVRTASFGTPTGISNDNSWSIYRAYTSLYDAERGVENDGIDDAVQNFDLWVNGRDLVANKEQWNIACYDDSTDRKAININGWTTSENTYLRIFTPVTTAEVGLSQRHRGRFGLGYKMTVTGASIIYVDISFVRIEGIQITSVNPANYAKAIYLASAGSGNAYFVSNNIIRVTGTNGGSTGGIRVIYGTGASIIRIFNNLFFSSGSHDSGYYSDYPPTVYLYNNTFSGFQYGIYPDAAGATTVLKSNIVSNSSVANYTGVIHASSNYNISSSATATGGANDKVSQTVAFVDQTGGDLRLLNSDTAAKNYCPSYKTDLVMAFTEDIAGNDRDIQGASWDCGAFEVPEYNFVDNDNVSVEFDAGTKTNVTWNTSKLELVSATVADKEDLSDMSTNLWGRWKINEATINNGSTVSDSSGGAHDGTVTTNNGATNKATSAKISGGASFDGDGDEIKMTYNTLVDTSNGYSFSMWFKTDTMHPAYTYQKLMTLYYNGGGQQEIILGLNPSGAGGANPTGELYFGWGNTGGSTNSWTAGQTAPDSISQDRWYHIVAVYDGTALGEDSNKFKIYINGVDRTDYNLFLRSATDPQVNFTPDTLRFMHQSDGTFDEAIVWQRALSATEIATLYNRQLKNYNNDVTATFTSRIFDSGDADAKWYDVLPKSPIPYGRGLPSSGNETTKGYSGGVNTADLIGYWSLDTMNSIHNATESAAYGGTTATYTTGDGSTNKSKVGKFNGGIYFDGVNDLMNIADNAIYDWAYNTSRSWSFWTKPKNMSVATSGNDVFSMYQSASVNMGIQVGSPNDSWLGPCVRCVTANFAWGGNWILSHTYSNVLEDDQYAFVTVTYDQSLPRETRVKIYVNGVDVTDMSDVGYSGSLDALSLAPYSIRVGGQENWPRYYNGEVDEVAMWNKKLTAAEISNLYQRGVARLKYQVRSCDDGACSGESWRGFDNTSLNFFDESLNALKSVLSFVVPLGYDINRYFQYKVWFESDDGTVTPALNSMEVRSAD